MPEAPGTEIGPYSLAEGLDPDRLLIILAEHDCAVAALIIAADQNIGGTMRDRAQLIVGASEASFSVGDDGARCSRLICPERTCRFGCSVISTTGSIEDVGADSVLARPGDGRVSGHPCQETGKL